MQTLQSFSSDEKEFLKTILATKVASMMGRKFEEDDWSACYCRAKNIPKHGWSNLNIDVMHNGLGVEHKMLCVAPNRTLLEFAGTSLMHPSATRSIRVQSTDHDPNETMKDIFRQYHELIELRTQKVLTTTDTGNADMRTGWLLWERSLSEFLYFEEPMYAPNPDHFYAEWNERPARGARKASKNLWIYENITGQKKFSVTTSAGAKIQPYFVVPAPSDNNLIYLKVQGEYLPNGMVQVWITPSTIRELTRILGNTDISELSDVILSLPSSIQDANTTIDDNNQLATPILLTVAAYEKFVTELGGVSDEHRAQLLLQRLRET